VSPLPGWYPDPAAPDTQRYWDGEQWIGEALSVDVVPPAGPPPVAPPAPVVPAPAIDPTAPPAPPAGGGSGDPTATAGWVRPTPPAADPAAGRPAEPSRMPWAPQAPQTGTNPQGPQAGANPSGQTLPPVPPGHIRLPGSTVAIPIDTTRLAPLGRRVVARLIDIFAVFLLCAVVNGYFWYRFAQEVTPALDDLLTGKETLTLSPEASRLNWIILLLTIGLWFAYEVPATANSGQTLGKRIMGIRVIRIVDDGALSFGQSIRRWLILMLPSPAVSAVCGLPLQLADLLWCTWDKPARQCLHDKAVTSIVVRAGAVSSPSDRPLASSSDVRKP
jgi:uncharacterized RDD family membrane protein YckC